MPTIPVRVHGRYDLRMPEGRTPALLLAGFHGYAQTAASTMGELLRIPGAEDWALLAVDALHPFYAAKTNEVVRSWMTRDERDLAIADNVDYVRAVLGRVRPEAGWDVPLAYVGFSQGVAMAWRAAALAGHGSAALVSIGADVPPELLERPLDHLPQALLARGERDDWYTAEKLAKDESSLAARGVRFETLVYAGGHEWTADLRAAAGAFLARSARR